MNTVKKTLPINYYNKSLINLSNNKNRILDTSQFKNNYKDKFDTYSKKILHMSESHNALYILNNSLILKNK